MIMLTYMSTMVHRGFVKDLESAVQEVILESGSVGVWILVMMVRPLLLELVSTQLIS